MNGAYQTCLDRAYKQELKKIQLKESDSKLMKQWNYIFKEVIKQKDKVLGITQRKLQLFSKPKYLCFKVVRSSFLAFTWIINQLHSVLSIVKYHSTINGCILCAGGLLTPFLNVINKLAAE